MRMTEQRKGHPMKKITGLILAVMIVLSCTSALALEGPRTYESSFETVTFGRYEQDNNPDNGPEPIRWIVLEKQDGRYLLFAKDLLDQHRYNVRYGFVTWEECELRTWLNTEFLQNAFTEEEQAAILLTDVDNSPAQSHPTYRTTSGNDTQDKIFLISYTEATHYFENNESRRSAPTDYAIARGVRFDRAYEIDGRPCGMWWTRSAGNMQWRVSFSYFWGKLNYTFATKEVVGIRPMLWVDFSRLPDIGE